MNSEILPKLNYNSKVVQGIKDLDYNIVWFDGEVCIIIDFIFYNIVLTVLFLFYLELILSVQITILILIFRF